MKIKNLIPPRRDKIQNFKKRGFAPRRSFAGFTLVETLVAISVLAFAFLGPLALGNFSIRSASVAKNQMTALFLAQDAMEFIRNRRDTNFLQREPTMVPWLTGLVDATTDCKSNNCCVDTTQNYPGGIDDSCSGERLRYDSSSGLYTYDINDPQTVFTRYVRFSDSPATAAYEKKVTITISWTERGYTRSFTLEENLMNWGGI